MPGAPAASSVLLRRLGRHPAQRPAPLVGRYGEVNAPDRPVLALFLELVVDLEPLPVAANVRSAQLVDRQVRLGPDRLPPGPVPHLLAHGHGKEHGTNDRLVVLQELILEMDAPVHVRASQDRINLEMRKPCGTLQVVLLLPGRHQYRHRLVVELEHHHLVVRELVFHEHLPRLQLGARCAEVVPRQVIALVLEPVAVLVVLDDRRPEVVQLLDAEPQWKHSRRVELSQQLHLLRRRRVAAPSGRMS